MDQSGKRLRKGKTRLKITSNPQMELFGDVSSRERICGTMRRGHRVFKERDPRGIRFGDMWLDEYLKQAEIKEPFIVRGLLAKQEWQAFEERYGVGGCAAYAPLSMTGLILYGLMQGVETLRGLERLARMDVGGMWVTGGITPDHATIGRFVTLHGDSLSGAFFESLTKVILENTRSSTGSLAGDGTVIQAVASRYKTIKQEAAELLAKEAGERAQGSEDKRLQAQAIQAQEVVDAIRERSEKRKAKGREGEVKVNPMEPEAVVQPLKEGGYAPSYKPSVLANEERIIVAYEVDPSNESRMVPALVDMAERVGGEKVGELLLDSGYFDHGVIAECIERDINLLCPEGKSQGEDDWTKKPSTYFGKSAFVYQEDRDVYVCPQGHEMRVVDRYEGKGKESGYMRYGTAACGGCPERERCTQNKKGRRIKRYAGDEAKDALREVMKDPRARARYRKRQAMVEPVFGYMKRVLKFTRFRRRGLSKVRLEFALYAMAYNLCRVVDRLKINLFTALLTPLYCLICIMEGIREKPGLETYSYAT